MGQGLAHYDHMKVIRFEALFKLTEELLAAEVVETCAGAAARRLKYIGDISRWRLLLPHGPAFLAVDGVDGRAQVSVLRELGPWQAQRWNSGHPEIFVGDAMGLAGLAPSHLYGPHLLRQCSIPIERGAQRVGLFLCAGRQAQVNPMDQKFIRMAASLLTDHLGTIQLRRQSLELLQHQATRDGLTGALNRRTVIERLVERRASNSGGASLCVLIADVDHFKSINDRFGHAAGDEVLREVVRRFSAQTREGEHFGRYGGEEFLFVLHADDNESALAVAERLRRSVSEQTIRIESTGASLDLPVTISLGLAHADDFPGAGPDHLIKRADEALYQSKALGRDCVTSAHASSPGRLLPAGLTREEAS